MLARRAGATVPSARGPQLATELSAKGARRLAHGQLDPPGRGPDDQLKRA
jgi:hypothetical protein